MDDPTPDADRAPSGSSWVRLALIFYGALFAVALLWSAWVGEPLFGTSVAAGASDFGGIRDLGAGVLAGGIVIALSHQLTQHTRMGGDLSRALGEMLGDVTTGQCLVLALASGIAEEAFFRGALQPQVGFIAASLIFGLAHFVPRRDLIPWTGFAVLAGFLLGWLFEVTGNLLAPITAHVLINAVNLRLLSGAGRS
jgi:membrane protease YdiL (CAAX protease family)